MEKRKKYAELHLHSTDLFDSMNKPDAVCKRMKELGAEGFALTQHGVVSGVEPMRKAAEKYGLKIVPGIESYYGNQGDIMSKKHMLLLSMDDLGWQAIGMAVSDSQNDQGFAVMSEEIIRKYFGEGGLGHGHVIATSACINGVIAAQLRENDGIDHEIEKMKKAHKKKGKKSGLKAMIEAEKMQDQLSDLQAELEEIMEKKKAAKKTANTPMDKRRKALESMQDGINEVYEKKKAEFDRDMELIAQAAAELEELTARQKTVKSSITRLEKTIREMEAADAMERDYLDAIRTLEAKKQSPEDLRKAAIQETLKFREVFGDGFFYMEVQNHGIAMEKEIYPVLASIARELQIPIVATNDVHLVDNTEDERLRRQIMRSMRFGTNWEEEHEGDDQLYIKTDDEMRDWLGRILPEDVVEEGMANIKVIFDRCNVKFESGSHYPKFPSEDGKTANEMLEEEIAKGIKWRFPEGMDEEHKKRLDHEVPIIENMGYADYHLIVKDFLEYGRELSAVPPEKVAEAPLTIEELKAWKLANGYTWKGGLLIGPGRGSAVGSLVCYLLGITNLDPLKYSLLFERFLNPERISMPDIDSDIGKRTRPKVIEYVQHKYGENAVCGILTQTAQAPKGCIRIAAKYYGMKSRKAENIPNDEKGRTYLSLGDEIAKRIPNDVGTSFGSRYQIPSPYEAVPEHEIPEKLYAEIEKHACKGAESNFASVTAQYIQKKLKEIRKTDETAKDATLYELLLIACGDDENALTIVHWAGIMEGVVTAYGAHAAGIVISDDHDVKEHLPLRWNKKLNEFTTQCDMVTTEEKGCLKMDFLGLKTLDIITDTSRAIYKNSGREIEILSIPLDDPAVYSEIFCKGRTNSVFQFESAGMKQMLKRFRPNRFEDLIILVSMFRPGPLQFIDNVIDVKNGKPAEYLTPELVPILGKTYASIVYQEQVMEIFQKLAGYTLGGADQVRRFMSKKKMDKLQHEREAFIKGDESRNIPGCAAKGISEEAANALFDQMTEFAKYAFNKSHAAAYAYLSYVTGWLKYYFPAEFLASAMNWAEKTQSKDPIPGLMEEAKSFGVEVLPPNVNYSGKDFTTRDGQIIFGLGGVNAVGAGGLDVMKEREANGKFTSLEDFFLRCDVKPNAAENLTYAGAFDDFTKNREALHQMIRTYKDLSKVVRTKRDKMKAIEAVLNAENADTDEKVIQAQVDAGYRPVIRKVQPAEKLQKRYAEAKEAYDADMRDYMSVTLPDVEYDHDFLLEKEHEFLGAYVTGHPMDGYIDSKKYTPLADMDTNTTDIFVLITELTPRRTKKEGREMATMTVEDRTGSMRIVIFSRPYEMCKDLLKKGAVLHMTGRTKEEETNQVDENGVAITRLNFSVEHVEEVKKREKSFVLHISSYARFHLTEEESLKEQYEAEDGRHFLVHDRMMNKFREMQYKLSEEAINYPGIREM